MTQSSGLACWAAILPPLFFAFSCGNNGVSNGSGNGSGHLVRVVNLRPSPITVTIGPATYEAIAPNDTTAYMEVNEGENEIVLNGEMFEGSPAEFGTGLGSCRWTYEFGTGHWGFEVDECDFLEIGP